MPFRRAARTRRESTLVWIETSLNATAPSCGVGRSLASVIPSVVPWKVPVCTPLSGLTVVMRNGSKAWSEGADCRR